MYFGEELNDKWMLERIENWWVGILNARTNSLEGEKRKMQDGGEGEGNVGERKSSHGMSEQHGILASLGGCKKLACKKLAAKTASSPSGTNGIPHPWMILRFRGTQPMACHKLSART